MSQQLRKQLRLFLVSILISYSLMAQTRTVSGTLVDEKRYPVADATVSINNSSVSKITDSKGYFSLLTVRVSEE